MLSTRAINILYPKVVDNQSGRDRVFTVMPQAICVGNKITAIVVQVRYQELVVKETGLREALYECYNFDGYLAIA